MWEKNQTETFITYQREITLVVPIRLLYFTTRARSDELFIFLRLKSR